MTFRGAVIIVGIRAKLLVKAIVRAGMKGLHGLFWEAGRIGLGIHSSPGELVPKRLSLKEMNV